MTFRTFFFLLLCFAALLLIVILAQKNQDTLVQSFQLFGKAQVPVYMVIVSGFLTGVGISLVWSLVRNARTLAAKWR